jgi:hypothetical protein
MKQEAMTAPNPARDSMFFTVVSVVVVFLGDMTDAAQLRSDSSLVHIWSGECGIFKRFATGHQARLSH